MKYQSRHPEGAGNVAGQHKDLPRTDGSTDVGYSYSKALAGCDRSHLQQDDTYTEEKISDETRSDRIDRGARRPPDRI